MLRLLSKDESYLVMKVMVVKEVMTGDVSPVAMFSKDGEFQIFRVDIYKVSN